MPHTVGKGVPGGLCSPPPSRRDREWPLALDGDAPSASPPTLRSAGVARSLRAPVEPPPAAVDPTPGTPALRASSPQLAIVLGMSATGLSALRLLGPSGVRCWGVDAGSGLPGFSSRYCERRIHMRDVSAAELARVLWDVIAMGPSRAVVLPTSDRFVRLLSALRDPQLVGRFDVALPAPEVVADLLDKKRFAARATQVGLRVPRGVAVADTARMSDAVRRVGYPALVKPCSPEQAGRAYPKAILLTTTDELRSLQTHHPPSAEIELIVQEYVPGDDLQHVSVAAALDNASRPLATFVARKRRQGNHGAGVGTFVESHRDDEAASMALQFLQEIGYVGVAEMELKRHAGTNELFAIEVNPRLWSQVTLPATLGLNFAMLYCQVATGLTPAGEPRPAAAQTATWQDLWDDFYWTFCHDGYWRRGEVSIATWLYQTWTSQAAAPFAWRDPLPAMIRLMEQIARGGKMDGIARGGKKA
jgi:D-aspartate ligase